MPFDRPPPSEGLPWPSVAGGPLPEAVSRRAVAWLVALDAPGSTDATRRACERWRREHADHERAWQHLESVGQRLRELSPPLAHGTLVRSAEGGDRARRRRAIKALAVAAFAGSGAWLARDSLRDEWLDWQADHRTATGERREVELADGTRIRLDTASAIDVRFDAAQRTVSLLHGQMMVTTGADPARPFLVETAQGTLRPIGTRFTVRQNTGSGHLVVLEGAVEVRPGDAGFAARVLRAGEQASFTRTAIEPARPADAAAAAWSSGMLVAHDMPLREFIAELSRYRAGRLACDPAVAELRVSGIYPLADTDRVLDMLLRTLPIETYSLTRYWVSVRPRGA